MGQYYKIVNLTKKQYFRPLSMLKLMEWSWLGNDTISLLHNLLKSKWKEDVVVVVGDYFEKTENKGYLNNSIQLYDVDEEKDFTEIKPKDFDFKLHYTIREQKKGLYLNYTKNEYIDLSKLKRTKENEGWVVSPLSLMVACGNGRGGGDYYGVNDFMVGIWAFDKVGIVTEAEEIKHFKLHFKEVIPNFKED